MSSKRKSKTSRTAQVRTKRRLQYSTLTARQRATYDRTTNLITDIRAAKGRGRNYSGSTTLLHAPPVNMRAGILSAEAVASQCGPANLTGVSVIAVPDAYRGHTDPHPQFAWRNEAGRLLQRPREAAARETQRRQVRDQMARHRIAGKEVFADAGTILEMADADVLKMETIYASVSGEQ